MHVLRRWKVMNGRGGLEGEGLDGGGWKRQLALVIHHIPTISVFCFRVYHVIIEA